MPRLHRLFLGFALAALSSKRAAAEPVVFDLEWRVPTAGLECLNASSVEQRVEEQLGRDRFAAPGSDSEVALQAIVSASVAPQASNSVRVDLELRRHGESLGGRSLEGSRDHCAALLESLVVVVALLVDLPRDELPLATASPAPSPNPPSRPVPASLGGAPLVPPAARSAKQLSLGLQATLLSGLQPGSSGGFGVASRFALASAPALGLRAGLDYFPRDRLAIAGGQLIFRSALLQLGLAPFRFGRRDRLNLEPWLMSALAGMHVEGRGFVQDRAGLRWIPLLGVTPRLTIPLSERWSLGVGGGLWLALLRPRFLLQSEQGAASLARPNRLSVSADFAACWRFW